MSEQAAGWMSEGAEQDEVLHRNEWLSLRRTPGGYVYAHEEKSGGQAVAVLVEGGGDIVLGRFEECPPHRDGLALCAITGQMDVPGESPAEAAKRELLEEAGMDVPVSALIPLGIVKAGKQTDTTVHLFLVAQGRSWPRSEANGDGTRGEATAFCDWVLTEDAMHSKDPLLVTMIARARNR